MANKTRLKKLEKMMVPQLVSNWMAPMIEIERGKESDPDHLKRMDNIRTEAEAAGWNGRGPYMVEVIKNAND